MLKWKSRISLDRFKPLYHWFYGPNLLVYNETVYTKGELCNQTMYYLSEYDTGGMYLVLKEGVVDPRSFYFYFT